MWAEAERYRELMNLNGPSSCCKGYLVNPRLVCRSMLGLHCTGTKTE